MKDYLFFLFKWMLVGIVFLIGIYQFNRFLFNNVHSEVFADTKTLIVGDSHFNSLHIDNAYHLGMDSEVYFTMYNKVREISQIAELEHVVISFSYLNMSKNYFDDFLKTNDRQAYSISKRNYALSSLSHLAQQSTYWQQLVKVLARYNFTLNYKYLSNWIYSKQDLPFAAVGFDLGVKESNIDFLKRFNSNRKRKLNPNTQHYKNKVAGKIENLYINPEKEVASENIGYLKKTIALCKEKGIDVWLVNTPLEPYYKEAIPDYLKKEFENLKNQLVSSSSNIHYLDYMDFFKESDFFADEHHVTGYGAALLSEELQKELDKK